MQVQLLRLGGGGKVAGEDFEDRPLRARLRVRAREWDDYAFRDHDRSWKGYRATQYRAWAAYHPETCDFTDGGWCRQCGKPTRRYVISDWAFLCGPECDRRYWARLRRDLSRSAVFPPRGDLAPVGF